jgi:lipopolysaccharide/colanic/teichoic acid biosynthesis glycosyltransferase
VDYQQRVAMDIYYIRNWSLWLDLLILLRTPWKVVQAEGAL